ncbi:XRE family transcriptional regulator [Amycolatopsis balhimycina DSM 5908]|uniref:XRE family transcriptional regulator n=2 Tax=Amycolatopsis balhimycina TaxID=208443 RepID=A0A428WSR5_AMYBA|nr:XRE family transcriptional regulator [Amycolatopsis balhimycina DSM 5908]
MTTCVRKTVWGGKVQDSVGAASVPVSSAGRVEVVDETGERQSPFGKLLLSCRRAAGLSQAQLAEASGVSVRALRELERGRAQAAQQRSAEVLADALGLAGRERALFLAVAKEGRRRGGRSSGACPNKQDKWST